MELIAHLIAEHFVFHVSNLKDSIYVLCRDHPALALLLFFVVFVVFVGVLGPSLRTSYREIHEVWRRNNGKLQLAIGAAAIFLVSGLSVVTALVLLGPVPIFDNVRPKTFIRDPAIVEWTYDPLQATGGPVTYEVLSASTSAFSDNDPSKTVEEFDRTLAYSHDEGTRYWKVHARQGDGKYGGWSKIATTTRYPDAYSRIKNNKKLIIFISNSSNQGFFKFYDRGKPYGADIGIGRAIAKRLTGDEKNAVFWPAPWSELLGSLNAVRDKSAPDRETPDLLISSITKSVAREQQYGIRFSEPYFCTTQALVHHKDLPSTNMGTLLKDKVVGYLAKTTSEDLINILNKRLSDKGMGFTPKPYDDVDRMIEAVRLKTGAIQLAMTDAPFAMKAVVGAPAQLRHKPLLPGELEDVGVPPPQLVERYAVGVHNGDLELLEEVNAAIRELNQTDHFMKKAVELYAQKNRIPFEEYWQMI